MSVPKERHYRACNAHRDGSPDCCICPQLDDHAWLYARLNELGISKTRLGNAMASRENWGGMVHAFEYLSVLGAVLTCWPEDPQ